MSVLNVLLVLRSICRYSRTKNADHSQPEHDNYRGNSVEITIRPTQVLHRFGVIFITIGHLVIHSTGGQIDEQTQEYDRDNDN
jgi:hypothetical protein